MINVKDLNKYYHKGKDNEIHVINNASLEIKEIGLVAFLGQSGSGKTTLLNVIGGLDKAKGKITYDDVSINNYQTGKIDKYRKKNIGYIFQNYSLLPNITVYENLRTSLNLIGIYDEKIISDRIECALTSVNMYKYRKRRAGTLSGGEQQRVAIARALIKNSKVIIADEPTGNLDSKNTIEVLNILKKISETRLVLLVTHNAKLAEFYADRIIQLKDGCIINDYENNDKPSEFGQEEAKTVYLGDLNKEEQCVSNINITKYSDGEMPNLELKIVYAKGSIFIESPLNIKLIGANTPVHLVEGNYQKMTANDITTDFNFDFKEETTKRGIFKGFLKRLGLAFKNFFVTRKRTYLLYFAFFITGMLMAICAYNVGKYVSINVDDTLYFDDAYFIINKDEHNMVSSAYLDCVTDANSGITSYECSSSIISYLSFKYVPNYSESTYRKDIDSIILESGSLKESSLISGKLPQKKNEAVVDVTIAKRIIDAYKDCGFVLNYNDLTKMQFSLFYDMNIVGVVDTNTTAIYCFESLTDIRFETYEKKLNKKRSEVDVEIVMGTDIIHNDQNECILPITEFGNYEIGDALKYRNDLTATVVGFYVSDSVSSTVCSDSFYEKVLMNNFLNTSYMVYVSTRETTIIEGRMPSAKDEVIISSKITDANYGIGKTVSVDGKTYTIVGKTSNLSPWQIGYGLKGLFEEWYYLDDTSIYFFTNDVAKTKAFVESKGYQLIKTYDYQVSNNNKYSMGIKAGDLFFIVFLAIETVFFVYFMMRAKMISRIKSVGIYRALGARKKTILKDFLIDLIILTIFTTLFGYIIGCCVLIKALAAFNAIMDVFVINMPVIILCGFGAVLLNIVFGMLPIILLLRKTPSEIIAKYDI